MKRAFTRVLCGLVVAASGCQPTPEYDVVLLGGTLVDGSGGRAYPADVAIRGERIVRVAPVGTLSTVSARRRVGVQGDVVAPGFIDILSQSRAAATARRSSKVTQGITTEILGEGITPAPVSAKTGGRQPAKYSGPRGFAGWLEAMETRGVQVNIGSFVGASTVRRYAMAGAARPPTSAELDTMRAVVRRAMEDGALGLGSALAYAPGSYATTEELIELARETAPFGGVYATHLRSEGDALIEAVDEALSIARGAGVPVEIHHLKAAGEANWPKLDKVIARIDSARAAGQDVEANIYPYTAARTRLSACLPPLASADGNLLERLADSSARARIRAEMLHGGENLCRLANPDEVLVGNFRVASHRQFEGMRLSEAARRLGVDWPDAVMDWAVREPQPVRATFPLASEDGLRLLMRQPWVKFGTDAAAVNPGRPPELLHPRAFGTYPRILGHYVREAGVLSLEEAIRKMTSAVARRLSLRDRGLVREGMYADLVVFDPATVADLATHADPHRLSVGVRHVFVNGVAVVVDGALTEAKPGHILRNDRAASALSFVVRYPTVGAPVPIDSIAVWGSVGDANASLTVNGRTIGVEENGAFVGWLPLPGGRDPTLEFVSTIGRRSASRRVPVVRVSRTNEMPAPRETRGWVRLRRLPSDTLDSVSLMHPVTARRSPGGRFALALPVGARLRMDARTEESVRVRLSDNLHVWALATEVDTLAAARPDPLPLGPIEVAEHDQVVELSASLTEPLPTRVSVERGELLWSVYGARPTGRHRAPAPGDRYVQKVDGREGPGGRADVRLRLAAAPAGWQVRWTGGRLTLELRRPRVSAGVRGLVVALDAGHPPGGTTGPTGLREDSVTLEVARAAAFRLEALGAHPLLVRPDERPRSIPARLAAAQAGGADVLISIHVDAPSPDQSPWSADGTRVFYYSADSRTLARSLHDSVSAALGHGARGVSRSSALVVLRSDWFPSVLVEGTCLVLPGREAWLRTRAGIEAYAEGLVRGVVGWASSGS